MRSAHQGLLILLTSLLASCSDSPPLETSPAVPTPAPSVPSGAESPAESPEPPQDFRGTITIGFERSVFQPKDTPEVYYWVSGAIQQVLPPGGGRMEDRSVDVEVEAVLSPPGRYGHLDGYERELRVTKVLSPAPG